MHNKLIRHKNAHSERKARRQSWEQGRTAAIISHTPRSIFHHVTREKKKIFICTLICTLKSLFYLFIYLKGNLLEIIDINYIWNHWRQGGAAPTVPVTPPPPPVPRLKYLLNVYCNIISLSTADVGLVNIDAVHFLHQRRPFTPNWQPGGNLNSSGMIINR